MFSSASVAFLIWWCIELSSNTCLQVSCYWWTSRQFAYFPAFCYFRILYSYTQHTHTHTIFCYVLIPRVCSLLVYACSVKQCLHKFLVIISGLEKGVAKELHAVVLILIVSMIIWRPSANNKRLVHTPYTEILAHCLQVCIFSCDER